MDPQRDLGAGHPKVCTSYESSEEKLRRVEENWLLKLSMKGNWGHSQPESVPVKENVMPLLSPTLESFSFEHLALGSS